MDDNTNAILRQSISSGVNLVDMGAANAIYTVSAIAAAMSTIFHIIYIVIGVFFGIGIIPSQRIYWLPTLILYFVISIIIGCYRQYMLTVIERNKVEFIIATCIKLTAKHMQKFGISEFQAESLVRSNVIPATKLIFTNELVNKLTEGIKQSLKKNDSI